MPGPKSNPQTRDKYDSETRQLRGNARANRKSAARLALRREAYDAIKFPTEHGFDMHRPGSQNRNK